jgi:SHS2 domain-containing protein
MSEPPETGGRGFRPLEHTADKSMEAWATTLAELFHAAAEGMFSESVSCAGIKAEQQWEIEVEADTVEELLHAWLSELLWVSERDEAAICRLQVDTIAETPWRVHGRAWGGPTPPDRPHTGAPVKAVTYHGLRVWQEGGNWWARVVFDV